MGDDHWRSDATEYFVARNRLSRPEACRNAEQGHPVILPFVACRPADTKGVINGAERTLTNNITDRSIPGAYPMSTLAPTDTGTAARPASTSSTSSAPNTGVFANLSTRTSRRASSPSSASGGGALHALVAHSMALASPAAPVHADPSANNFFNPTRLAKIRFNGPVTSGSIDYYTGTVKKDAQGRLEADDFLVNSLLQFAQTPTLGSTRTLRDTELQGDQASLTFSMDPRIVQCHDDFSKLCRVSDIDIKRHATSQQKSALGEDDVPIIIPTLLKVMLEGRAAFKPDAKVGLPGRENQHPYDYLAEMMPQIISDNPGLKTGLDGVLGDRPDYRARLAASQLLKMATEKQSAPAGWALSTGLAVGFQTPWVQAAIPAFTRFLGQHNLSPTRAAAALAGLNTIPSTMIEMVDATIGFAILSAFKKEDWTIREIAPKAALAGLISGVTSFPYNLLQETGGIPDGRFPAIRNIANLGLNVVAAATQVMGAGIGIPMEAQAGKAKLTAALAHSIGEQDGLLSMPSDVRDAKQAEAYINELASRATHHNPSDGVAQASVPLMLGAAMMSVALNAQGIVTHGQQPLIPDAALKIIDITTFQPIEAHTLHAVWLASKVDMPPLMKSDERKHKMLLDALTRAETSGKPFTREDLNRIDPNLLRKMGAAISETVMSVIQLIPHSADGLRGRDTRLSSRVIYPQPASDSEHAGENRAQLPQIRIGDPADAV